MIIEYVQAKYGFDHVSQIVTYNELGVKSIIKNVGKVLGIPYAVTDDLSKNVPKTIRKHVYLDEEDTWEDRDEPVKTLDDLKNFSKTRLIITRTLPSFLRLVSYLTDYHHQPENMPVESSLGQSL